MRPSACGPTGASLHACDSNGCGCVRPETAHSGQTRPSSSRPATAGYEEAIVVGSVTPSYLFSPPDAALLQHELGIPVWRGPAPREIVGADVSLACSSWATSLIFCYALIRAGLAQ